MSATGTSDNTAVNLPFDQKRRAEMDTGRAIVRERMAQSGNLAHTQRMFKDADAAIKEDEERRRLTIEAPETLADKAERDRAGAEVIDQAQTLLEAVGHLADRQEPILDFRRQNSVETLEDETVDTGAAKAITTDHVTAQAVNQPVVLANEQGLETETQPLNNSMFADSELELGRVVMPPEQLTPRTRKRAEKIAAQKVPDAEQVVGNGKVRNDADPSTEEAIDVFNAAPDEALGHAVPGDADARRLGEVQTPKAEAKGKK